MGGGGGGGGGRSGVLFSWNIGPFIFCSFLTYRHILFCIISYDDYVW